MKAPRPLPLDATLPNPSPGSPQGRGACCPHLAQPSPAVPGRSPRPLCGPLSAAAFISIFFFALDRLTFFYLYVDGSLPISASWSVHVI